MSSLFPPADLPDLNVWLALTASQHPHHAQALHYWEQLASQEVLFCTVTALGLTRLLSQPKVMGEAVLTSAEASNVLRALCKQGGVGIATPGDDGWDLFHTMLSKEDLPGRLHTDAHLAALTIANGWRLVSFDRDFERFEGLNWLRIS